MYFEQMTYQTVMVVSPGGGSPCKAALQLPVGELIQLKNLSLKSITVAYNNSLRILLNLPSRCTHVVQVLCLPPIILNILMNTFFLYLAFYVVFISLKTLYLSITFRLIYILEVWCTHTGDPYCSHNIVFYPIFNYYFKHWFHFISCPIYIFLLPTYCFTCTP